MNSNSIEWGKEIVQAGSNITEIAKDVGIPGVGSPACFSQNFYEKHLQQRFEKFLSYAEIDQESVDNIMSDEACSNCFNENFGYRTITVERPLRDAEGNVVLSQGGKAKGQPQADSSLRDTENVPLSEDVQTYFERKVLPHVSDAWIDHDKTKVGYEIPFNRHFDGFTPPRPLEVIDAELKPVTNRILAMIGGLPA
jgi:hypothetical protein